MIIYALSFSKNRDLILGSRIIIVYWYKRPCICILVFCTRDIRRYILFYEWRSAVPSSSTADRSLFSVISPTSHFAKLIFWKCSGGTVLWGNVGEPATTWCRVYQHWNSFTIFYISVDHFRCFAQLFYIIYFKSQSLGE